MHGCKKGMIIKLVRCLGYNKRIKLTTSIVSSSSESGGESSDKDDAGFSVSCVRLCASSTASNCCLSTSCNSDIGPLISRESAIVVGVQRL